MGDLIQLVKPTGLKINPCPFCGGTNCEVSAENCWTDHHVECEDCLCQGPSATLGCRDPEEDTIDLEAEAIQMWNDRKDVSF